MKTFRADTIEAEVDDAAEIPAYLVRLSDESSTGRLYVQFEKLIEPDVQDLELGFDFPHIEICDQGFSGYNLVERVVCDAHTLTVFFNKKGRRVLQFDDEFQISLGENLDLSRMIELLRIIFGERFIER